MSDIVKKSHTVLWIISFPWGEKNTKQYQVDTEAFVESTVTFLSLVAQHSYCKQLATEDWSVMEDMACCAHREAVANVQLGGKCYIQFASIFLLLYNQLVMQEKLLSI